MATTPHFDIGFIVTEGRDGHLFLSVSLGFEHGPGIRRDGISSPRMTDPHSLFAIRHHFNLSETPGLESTTNAFIQRTGTWALYHHLKRFIEHYGKQWRVVAVQSNGDLTMNYWHVAYIREYGPHPHPMVCGLFMEDRAEPIETRSYRSLVK
jgi:hypothetical protein